MKKEDKLILVGVISAAHGIKGDLIIRSFTNPCENILNFNTTDANGSSIKLKKIRINTNGTIVCKYSTSQDRNFAETLIGTKLYCRRQDLSILADDEFYIDDLKSMKVLNTNQEIIGTIINVANYGGGDLIEIRFSDDREEMFPFTKELFPQIGKDYVILSKITL